jgi:hypothetical protein
MLNLLQQNNVTAIISIPPLTFQYTPSLNPPTYYSCKEPLLTSIMTTSHTTHHTNIPLCLHNLHDRLFPLRTTIPYQPRPQMYLLPFKILKAWHIIQPPPYIHTYIHTYIHLHPTPTTIHHKRPPLTIPTNLRTLQIWLIYPHPLMEKGKETLHAWRIQLVTKYHYSN